MDARFLNVPDGRLLHDVPHLKPLDRLVLRRTTTRKAGTTNESETFHQARVYESKEAVEAFTHLGAALGAVGATDVLDMAAAVLVAAAVAALESLRIGSR
jgi:hypothetical protein